MYLCKKIAHLKTSAVENVHIFWQLVAKFADFWQNNNIYGGKKRKKNTHLKNISYKETVCSTVSSKFADFWQNNSVFIQKNCTF